MSAYTTKLRHIMPVYLYVTVGTLLALCAARYFLAIETDLLDFKLEIWQIWIPLVLPWIPITIWLRPRFRILIFKSHSDQRQFFFQFLTWLPMAGSLMLSQMYLTTASGELQQLSNIAHAYKKESSQYYKIDAFQVLKSFGGEATNVRASGKHNQHLNIHLYFAFPIVKDTINVPPDSLNYWYGVTFEKQISNRASIEEKEALYDVFYKESIEKIKRFPFYDLKYFERLANTEDRDGYLKAVANRFNQDTEIIILEPRHEAFENRNGDKLEWAFGIFSVGTILMLLFLTWPRLSKMELNRQLAGKKPKEDDVVEMFKFLIPKHPHFVTSIILDLNILVFLLMMFAGVHILSPNGLELLEWGANRRTETTSGEWWRLLSSMFLHGGIMHLILNIYGLILASIFIEPMIGPVRYAIIYFVSGIAGSVASIWWYENTISVGASGAIFGVCGAVLALTLTGTLNKDGKKAILILFGPYVGLNLLMGLVGGIDNAAHLGGLITGAFVGLMIYSTMKPNPTEDPGT